MVRDNVQGDNPRRLLGTTAKITVTGNRTLLVPRPVFLARNNALRPVCGELLTLGKLVVRHTQVQFTRYVERHSSA